jgi:ABC-2 type transport system permease protein
MSNTGTIINSSIKNNLNSKTLTVAFIGMSIMLAAGLVIFLSLMLIKPLVEAGSPERSDLELYLTLVTYTTCIICLGISLNVFAFQSMTREKARGNIESLLATPLKIKDIWIAKSLAIFLPGLVLGVVLGVIVMVAINYIYFVPVAGFIFTPWIAITCFLAAPLIYLCLSLLTHLVGLFNKTANGNIIAQISLPVILSLMINLMLHHVVDAASWSFTLLNLGLALLIFIVTLVLLPRLGVERVVLSQ